MVPLEKMQQRLGAVFAVWNVLWDFADPDQKVRTFYQELAEHAKLSRGGLRRHLERLATEGWLTFESVLYIGNPPRPLRVIKLRGFRTPDGFFEMAPDTTKNIPLIPPIPPTSQNVLTSVQCTAHIDPRTQQDTMPSESDTTLSSLEKDEARFREAQLLSNDFNVRRKSSTGGFMFFDELSKVDTFFQCVKTSQIRVGYDMVSKEYSTPMLRPTVESLDFFDLVRQRKSQYNLSSAELEAILEPIALYERDRARARASFSFFSSFSEIRVIFLSFFGFASETQKNRETSEADASQVSLFLAGFAGGRYEEGARGVVESKQSDPGCSAELETGVVRPPVDRGFLAPNSPCDPCEVENPRGGVGRGLAPQETPTALAQSTPLDAVRVSELPLHSSIIDETTPPNPDHTFIQEATPPLAKVFTLPPPPDSREAQLLSNDFNVRRKEVSDVTAPQNAGYENQVIPLFEQTPGPRIGVTQSFSEAFRSFLDQCDLRMPKDPDAPAPLPPGWEVYIPRFEPKAITLRPSAYVYNNSAQAHSGEQVWSPDHSATVHINRPKSRERVASRIQAHAALYYARVMGLIPDYPWHLDIPKVSSPLAPKLTSEMTPELRVRQMMCAFAGAVRVHLGQKYNHAWMFGKGRLAGKGFDKMVLASEALIEFRIPPVEWALHGLYMYIEIKASGRAQFLTKPPPPEVIFSPEWIANKVFKERYWRVAPLCSSKVWTPPSARVLYTRWSDFSYAVTGSIAVSPRDVQRLFSQFFPGNEFQILLEAARYEAQERLKYYQQQLTAYRWIAEWNL